MEIQTILLSLSVKDWIIIILLFFLGLNILYIRKLKRLIAYEIKKRILPQLNLELMLEPDKTGLYLRNDGFSLVRDIEIENVELPLDDYGFRQDFILKFEGLDYIKPQETAKLNFKVYDKEGEFLQRITETIIPHLSTPVFKVKISYSNIDNLKNRVIFFKEGTKFISERIKEDE